MDLKAMPVRSYHGYNYFLIIFDDATSHGWTVNLKQKSDADPAIQQFIAIVKTQFGLSIKEVQIVAGVNLNLRNLLYSFKNRELIY